LTVRTTRLSSIRLQVILGASVLLTACFGPEGTTVSATPSSAEASATPSGSSASTLPTEAPTEEPAGQNFIAWILNLAPGSPTGPPEFRAYRALMEVASGGCVRLADGLAPDGGIELEGTARALYAGAADACLAAFHGRADLWGAAIATYAALPSPTSCMDVAAHRLYGELIRWHAENPNGQFVALVNPGQAQEPPCPTVTALTPDRGPRGTTVLVTGINLASTFELWLFYEDDDGDEFARQVENYVIVGEALEFTMQDDTNIAVYACVVPQGAPGWNGTGMRFTIEPSPASTDTAAPTSPPAPSQPCPPPSGE
jgi:hypothetical protein